MDYLVIGCRCLVGLVFAVSAGSKLRNRAAFREFTESVASLRLVADRWVGTAAVAVAGGEVAIAVLMFAPPPQTAFGFGLAVALLTTFAIAIAVSRRRGATTTCRCFGTGRAVLGNEHVKRNAVLAMVAVLGAAAAAAAAEGSRHGTHPAGAAIAVTAGAAAALLVIAMDDVIALFRATPTAAVAPPAPDKRSPR